jgi:hypothetical protein
MALEDGYAYDMQGARARRPLDAGGARVARAAPATVWPLIGAQAVASGDQHILVFGGSHRDVWNDQIRKNATLSGGALTAFREPTSVSRLMPSF